LVLTRVLHFWRRLKKSLEPCRLGPYTDRYRRILWLANKEAKRSNHEYVGTEHILLALVKEGSGPAAGVLSSLGIDLKGLRRVVEKIVPRGPEIVTFGTLPLTASAREVIDRSLEEAQKLNHSYVGSEHLLLAILREEEESVACQIFRNMSLSPEKIKAAVLKLPQFSSDQIKSPGLEA
jgi:ATP-dependent Clp protease ATP-binding subunit ClpC